MEFYNNFVDTNFSNENYGNNAVSTATPLKFSNEIYPPSPSSSPIYNNHSYMTDIYNIKMEQLVSPESYGVPPSPPDSYQSIASPKLNIDYKFDGIYENKQENSISLFNEPDLNIEPIISLVLEEAKLDSKSICELLKINLSKYKFHY